MPRHGADHGLPGPGPEGRGAGRSHGGVRSAQLASLVQRIVQGEIQSGLADPRMRGMVTVLGVEPSADLEEATVRVSVLPGEFGPLSVQALNHAAAHMRRAVLKQSRVRHAPRLRFVLDESLKRAAAVDAAIREATGDHGADEDHHDEIDQ